MGLSRTSFFRFKSRVTDTLRAIYPATLLIDTATVTGTGPGGKTQTSFLEGGLSSEFRFPFRVPRSGCPVGWTPLPGKSVDWVISETETLALEITQSAVHPFEDEWEFTARCRRQ